MDVQDSAVRVTLIATNDIHGTVDAREIKLGTQPGRIVDAKVGGLDALASYITAARAANPGRMLWLDAGDQYQSSLISNKYWGRSVVEALNALGLTAATFGNHEFDYGPGDDALAGPQGAMLETLRRARFPYLSANIATDAATEALPNTRPSEIFDVDGIACARK